MKNAPKKESRNNLITDGTHMVQPCHVARSCNMAWLDRAILLAGWSCQVCWRTAVRLDACPCRRLFVRVVLFLMARAASNLCSSSQSSQNAIFASKTRRFFLKAQKSRNVSKIA